MNHKVQLRLPPTQARTMAPIKKIIEITTSPQGSARVQTSDDYDTEQFDSLTAALAYAFGLRSSMNDHRVTAAIHIDGREYTLPGSLI